MEELRELERLAVLLSLPGTALIVLLPLYIKALGGGSELIGIASSVGPITFAIVRLVGGAATDVFGRKKTFIVGLVMYTIGLLMLALAPEADVVALGGSLTGAGAMISLTSAIVIVADVAAFAEVYGRLASKVALGGILGSAVPFALLYLLPEIEAFRITFFVYFLVASYATIKSKELKETKPKTTKLSFEWSSEWLAATVIGSMAALASGIVTPFYPVYISSKFQLGAIEVMLSYAPSALASVLSPRISGALAPEISLILFNAIGTIGSAWIVLGGLALASVGLALVVGAVGGGAVAQDALVAKGCKRSCGFMIGLYASITQLFMGIGSLLAGMLYSRNSQLVFILASAFFMMATVLSFLYLLASRKSAKDLKQNSDSVVKH